MTKEEFITAIRSGVLAGAYDMKYAIGLLETYGAHTAGDIKAEDRKAFIAHLDGRVSE